MTGGLWRQEAGDDCCKGIGRGNERETGNATFTAGEIMARRTSSRFLPRAEYLIGYVPDSEPLDSIMKKFQQLEAFQQMTGRADLTAEDCQELMTNTSLGSVRECFRPHYDVSEDSEESDFDGPRSVKYMDPITQSYRSVNQPREGGEVLHQNIFSLRLSGQFQAILLNPPEGLSSRLKQRLKFLKSLMKNGLVFIWSHKSETRDWVEMMEKVKFQYVENLVWVQVDEPSVKKAGGLDTLTDFSTQLLAASDHSPFATAHRTLLLFRRVPAQKLELRHQRTCDVVFDYSQPQQYVYHMIETLLPAAGRKLELWANGNTREGWLHVVHCEDKQE